MSSIDEERRGYRVLGRVQGVGFRWSTRQRADELGLRGSIRNREDGSVELSVAGPPQRLERLVDWLSVGPPGARVEAVLETPADLPVPEIGFQIVR